MIVYRIFILRRTWTLFKSGGVNYSTYQRFRDEELPPPLSYPLPPKINLKSSLAYISKCWTVTVASLNNTFDSPHKTCLCNKNNFKMANIQKFTLQTPIYIQNSQVVHFFLHEYLRRRQLRLHFTFTSSGSYIWSCRRYNNTIMRVTIECSPFHDSVIFKKNCLEKFTMSASYTLMTLRVWF